MISIFDIFKVGLGPSSSHTVGPMKAAVAFVELLQKTDRLAATERIAVEVYGSLALTGIGHATFDALLLGLEGSLPNDIDLNTISQRLENINSQAVLQLTPEKSIHFEVARDLVICMTESLPKHPNGLCFIAYDGQENKLVSQVFYSIGGGFIVTDEAFGQENADAVTVPYPFSNATELFALCAEHNLTVSELVMANEVALCGRDEATVKAGIRQIKDTMFACIDRGLTIKGILPGGLNVTRRAPALAEKISSLRENGQINTQLWPMVYAMAVNEENAAGGRVVTAPTNGAAGIIPSVLKYFANFHPNANDDTIADFLLTAGVIGILYKNNASISGADVGCQGEVGVACSMAAGAFSAVSGGTLAQIENAAEMAMEHHLGLTCDPVAGLVQIPCIERNGIAAEKAIKLGALSLLEDGTHKKVTLDMVIKTMLQTGRDMKSTYKETSLAGLATTLKRKAIAVSVSVIEC
ncbi:MAG: L-serine ammonia-lyase [Neisseriaceae bacterium]|nr:L-serine ammonia-lyase [Neisseriaceae bacterium]